MNQNPPSLTKNEQCPTARLQVDLEDLRERRQLFFLPAVLANHKLKLKLNQSQSSIYLLNSERRI